MKLRLDRVSHRFAPDAPWCLRSVSLAVHPGEVVGLSGPSGSGKSLLLRVASTLLRPTEGSVTLDDLDPAAARASAAIGYVSPSHRCPDDVTVRAYLTAMAALHRRGDGDVDGALELTDLVDRADAPGGALSLGERRRLELSRALLHDPSLLLLDDPSPGLDAAARDDLSDFIVTLASLGKAVLLASSLPEELRPLCARVLTLDADHRLVAQEDP